jgi:hypothetical protein
MFYIFIIINTLFGLLVMNGIITEVYFPVLFILFGNFYVIFLESSVGDINLLISLYGLPVSKPLLSSLFKTLLIIHVFPR